MDEAALSHNTATLTLLLLSSQNIPGYSSSWCFCLYFRSRLPSYWDCWTSCVNYQPSSKLWYLRSLCGCVKIWRSAPTIALESPWLGRWSKTLSSKHVKLRQNTWRCCFRNIFKQLEMLFSFSRSVLGACSAMKFVRSLWEIEKGSMFPQAWDNLIS